MTNSPAPSGNVHKLLASSSRHGVMWRVSFRKDNDTTVSVDVNVYTTGLAVLMATRYLRSIHESGILYCQSVVRIDQRKVAS